MSRQTFTGPIIHVDENNAVAFKSKVTILVEDGKIIDVTEHPDQQTLDDFHADEVNDLLSHQFLIPGLIDCHTHAAQFPNLGLGYDKTLLDWQEAYTYPLEMLYIDREFADKVFDKVVRRTILNGTTTACYSASLDREAATILAQKCAQYGQRAFVGKINMNAPRDDGYYESTEKSIANTNAFIKSVEKIANPLVQPIITPRSALTCDMDLMQKLGNIAKDKDLLIQSHISQDKDEVKAVKSKFGKATYTEVYEAAGFLDKKTILSHGTYLEASEISKLAEKKIPIVHCPSSNFNLRSGFCKVDKLKKQNVDVCIGTDISGGSNYNILNEMRMVLQVSNSLYLTGHSEKPIDHKSVFSMATLGAAKALRIDDKVGNFVKGKEFDALVVDFVSKDNFFDWFKDYSIEELLQRFIYCGTFNNIAAVYIKGRKVR